MAYRTWFRNNGIDFAVANALPLATVFAVAAFLFLALPSTSAGSSQPAASAQAIGDGGEAGVLPAAGSCNRDAMESALDDGVMTVAGKHGAVVIPVDLEFADVPGFDHNMDNGDRACLGQALELAPIAHSVSWTNPDTGFRYQVTSFIGFIVDGRERCRGFVLRATDDAHYTNALGASACTDGDGVWRLSRFVGRIVNT